MKSRSTARRGACAKLPRQGDGGAGAEARRALESVVTHALMYLHLARGALALVLSVLLFAIPAGAAEDPGNPGAPAGGERAAAPATSASDLSDAERLAAALKLKEERRLEEAILQLEVLARAGRAGSSASSSRIAGERPIVLDEKGSVRTLVLTAAGILAELEVIDARLRLGRLEGLTERLRHLSETWSSNGEIRRRARALAGILPLRGGTLLEPNAISRADLGRRFKERFFPGREEDQALQIPLDTPIRKLSHLQTGTAAVRGPRARAVSLIGFLEIGDLSSDRMARWRPALESFDDDPRVLLALFIFIGDGELPASMAGEEPFSRAAVFWIRGTPAALSSAPVRSRYEWLPGPTFFLLDPADKIRSWCWPHEGWAGFKDDLQAALAGRPAAVDANRPEPSGEGAR